MPDPRYPSLYQINTRVWLTELSHALGRPATLDDIPDAELDRIAKIPIRRFHHSTILLVHLQCGE
jgi:hypothetical protein